MKVFAMRVLVFLCAGLWASLAVATQVLALDIPEIVAESEVIVRARVASVVAERVPESPGRTHTRVGLEVLERLGGLAGFTLPTALELTTPGGRLGRFAQWVPGAPTFTAGEEIVVALARNGHGRFLVVGFNQGLWRVIRTAGQATIARSERSGVELVRPGPSGQPTVINAPAVDTRALDSLLAALRTTHP